MKKTISILSIILLCGSMTSEFSVFADDDKDQKGKEYYEKKNDNRYESDRSTDRDKKDDRYRKDDKDKQKKEKYDSEKAKKHKDESDDDDKYYKTDDDDDHDEYDEEEGTYTRDGEIVSTEATTWYSWNREVSSMKGQVPFTEVQNINLVNTDQNQSTSIRIVPKNGELFVPAKAVSHMFGSDAELYVNSKILLVKKQNTELIFRAGTNVVYENQVKTPLPEKAFFENNDLYIPISVIANGLGYAVKWDEQKKEIIIEKLP